MDTKFKNGDIVYRRTRYGDDRFYLVEWAGLDYLKVLCLFMSGKIVDAEHPTTWFRSGLRYKDTTLATAKMIEKVVFPEGLAFLKANIDSNVIKNSIPMNHLIVAVEKSLPRLEVKMNYENGAVDWINPFDSAKSKEENQKTCNCTMFTLLSQGCSCGGK
jgi:hypothetical protein